MPCNLSWMHGILRRCIALRKPVPIRLWSLRRRLSLWSGLSTRLCELWASSMRRLLRKRGKYERELQELCCFGSWRTGLSLLIELLQMNLQEHVYQTMLSKHRMPRSMLRCFQRASTVLPMLDFKGTSTLPFYRSSLSQANNNNVDNDDLRSDKRMLWFRLRRSLSWRWKRTSLLWKCCGRIYQQQWFWRKLRFVFLAFISVYNHMRR